MSNNYKSEIEEFNKNFCIYKNSRIALYGIGRMTMTLLTNLEGYNIVALLDKDESNVGKVIHGVRIVSCNEVVDLADIIIINTSATYWDIIAERIKDVGLPVFYRNGQVASYTEDKENAENKYWNISIQKIKEEIDTADVVAFDFFDTLFMRRVMLPEDVLKLVNLIVKEKYGLDNYLIMRRKIIAELSEDYSLKDLYDNIRRNTNITQNGIDEIYNLEFELENKMLVPRNEIVEMLNYSIKKQKKIYVVSDMYLPFSFFESAIKNIGIDSGFLRILISCENKASKKKGELWKYLIDENKSKKIMCIGDNYENDIAIPERITNRSTGFCIASAYQLLCWSSLRDILNKVVSLESEIFMGLIIARLFNNPFALNCSKGKVKIEKPRDCGYVVFGPVILEFCKWIKNNLSKDGINEVVFMTRDGYFLKPCFEYYCNKVGNRAYHTKYIGISRQLAMVSAIESEEDLINYIEIPYSGTIKDLLEDRFKIKADTDQEVTLNDIKMQIKENKKIGKELWNYVNQTKKNYKKYLESISLSDNSAVVDIGYYGNNQKYLQKILGKKLNGYYLVANLDKTNPNTKSQHMKACFQNKEDTKALNSQLYAKGLFLESFLTAPYGMVTEVNGFGEFICKKGESNQRYFSIKEEIFKGVLEFIGDYCDLFANWELDIDIDFCNYWYDYSFSKRVEYSETIKRSFNNDNALMNRFDNSLFE